MPVAIVKKVIVRTPEIEIQSLRDSFLIYLNNELDYFEVSTNECMS